MNRKNNCLHNEITAKYNIGEFLFDDQTISIRTMTWVCKDCGEYGVEAEKIKFREGIKLQSNKIECRK